MTLVQAILLGILQGLTEFLPVSSSAHLVIVPHLLQWPDPGLTLDTILHLGTIIAVIIYFWRDLWELAIAAWNSLRSRSLAEPKARLAWLLAAASVPGALLGVLFEDWFEQIFGMPKAAAAFLLVTAALLLISEYLARRERTLEAMGWRDALLIGLAQALAIVPGLSRSGATIAAGLLLGFKRDEAARFSFLLAVPIVVGGGAYQGLKLLMGEASSNLAPAVIIAGFCAAAFSGYMAITGMLALVKRRSLHPFAIYCAIFGLLVLTGILG